MHKFELYTPIKAHIAIFWIIISLSSYQSSDKCTALVEVRIKFWYLNHNIIMT